MNELSSTSTIVHLSKRILIGAHFDREAKDKPEKEFGPLDDGKEPLLRRAQDKGLLS